MKASTGGEHLNNLSFLTGTYDDIEVADELFLPELISYPADFADFEKLYAIRDF